MSAEDSSLKQRSLYRRHRPRTFAEVVGQEPVVRTLRHAVERDKVHHAYLFVGSRGTGKTSMAKILAACLNCARGRTIDPCGECESCLSIARANSLDVIEMDAASNNSVDDIRDLRESVAYAPVSGGRKVYILDEAHMLSTAAWNAFLKTLEEPPPNTVFVLATTEANKVPPTVVDRCHRFDFHRPSVEQIAAVVRRTATAESIEIPPAAVAALARSATGSFRDALGTLEQLVTYSGSQIALEDVLAVLGVADSSLLEGTVDAVASGDAKRALQTLEEAVEQGRDAASFATDLEVRARELLVVQTLGAVPDELALTDEADAALAAQAERVEQSAVVRLLELLGEAMEAVRAGADPRTRLELALVKAARPEADGSMRALLARIERLESGRPSHGAPDAAPAAAAASAPTPSAAPATQLAEGVQARHSEPAPASATQDVPATPDAGVAAGLATAEPVAEVALAEDLEAVAASWPAVVEMVKGKNELIAAVIAKARPVALDGEDLTLAFSATDAFIKKKAEDPAYRQIVGEALRAVTTRRLRLSYELRAELGDEQGEDPTYSEEDWIRRLMDEFDAEEVPLEWEPDPADSTAQGETGAPAATSYQKGA